MTDPQRNTPVGFWAAHDGTVLIADMSDAYLINAYRTAERHGSVKADELAEEMQYRGIQL